MCRFNYPKPISHSTVFAKPCDIENESPAQKTARLKLAGTVLSNVKEFLYNADNYETLHKAAVKCSKSAKCLYEKTSKRHSHKQL